MTLSHALDRPPAAVHEARLPNGLLVLTYPMRVAAVVSVYMWYRVGGRHDPRGGSGLSHWLEHMLYKATRNFPVGEIPRLLASHGAQWNGFTWYDYTSYFATLPSDALDVALSIEADRMRNAELEPGATERERAVVRAEIATSADAPSQVLRERMLAAVFGAREYGRPLAGTSADLESATRAQLVEHYQHWYRPDNAVLVIAGDVDPERVVDRVNSSFGGITGDAVRTPVVSQATPAPSQRRIVVRGPGFVPVLQVLYPIPAAAHADFLPLSVAASALGGGRRARLHSALVQAGLASRVDAAATMARAPFVLNLEVALTRDADPERVYATIQAEVNALATGLAADIEAVKRRLRHMFVLGSEGVTNHARLIGRYEMADSYHRFLTYLDDLQRVTRGEVQRVVEQYLTPERAVVGHYEPDSTQLREAPLALALEHLHP